MFYIILYNYHNKYSIIYSIQLFYIIHCILILYAFYLYQKREPEPQAPNETQQQQYYVLYILHHMLYRIQNVLHVIYIIIYTIFRLVQWLVGYSLSGLVTDLTPRGEFIQFWFLGPGGKGLTLFLRLTPLRQGILARQQNSAQQMT